MEALDVVDSFNIAPSAFGSLAVTHLWAALIALFGALIVARRVMERRHSGSRQAQLAYTALGMSALTLFALGAGAYLAWNRDFFPMTLVLLGGLVALHSALAHALRYFGRKSNGWHLGLLHRRREGSDPG